MNKRVLLIQAWRDGIVNLRYSDYRGPGINDVFIYPNWGSVLKRLEKGIPKDYIIRVKGDLHQ